MLFSALGLKLPNVVRMLVNAYSCPLTSMVIQALLS
jgi:hypothetical protein